MDKVGFIGLGNIGKGCALNIIKKGFELRVYDIRSEPIEELVRAGAKATSNPKEIAESSDIILFSLPSGEASLEVALDPQKGVLANAKQGSVIVEMSTILPSTVRKIAEAARKTAIEVIDSPVTGSEVGAKTGTLRLFVGGSKDVFERCLPVLRTFSIKQTHVGDVGAGEVVKLVNNLCGLTNYYTAVEAVALGAKAGIDLETLFECIKDGTGNSWYWENRIGRILARKEMPPPDPYNIRYKDLKTISTMARELGAPVPLLEAALHQCAFFKAEGINFGGELDYLEKMLGVVIKADVSFPEFAFRPQ